MKPTPAQRFFASAWPMRIWFTALPGASAIWVSWICAQFLDPLAGWRDFVQMALYVGVAWLLGFFLALFPGWLILGPLYYDRELKNGGPFQIGDTVRILSGAHKDRVCRIYAEWQGNSVRVDLGDEARERFADIFSPVELLREEWSAAEFEPEH